MKHSVLIIDDEKTVRESLAKVFRNAGYDTLLAAGGCEGATVAAQQRPDAVLLDLNMPDMNGWEAFERISASDPLTPVVILTGRPGQFELAAAARVGALIEKPVEVLLLLETVRRLIAEPLASRVSRLAFCQPRTSYVGANAAGGDESDEGKRQELVRLRKGQLNELRFNREDVSQ